MTSRNLAIKEDVYNKLLEAKKGNESFSDVIDRLLHGKSELLSFAGVLAGDKDFEAVMVDIEAVRENTVLKP
ncbi:MAG TPA: antitoxin VapB family protein [Nitrososphaerales archaeon]|nr:antitoxin VapB family protein [Nitrososphaerales archaeon]